MSYEPLDASRKWFVLAYSLMFLVCCSVWCVQCRSFSQPAPPIIIITQRFTLINYASESAGAVQLACFTSHHGRSFKQLRIRLLARGGQEEVLSEPPNTLGATIALSVCTLSVWLAQALVGFVVDTSSVWVGPSPRRSRLQPNLLAKLAQHIG